jgi:GNAT superfamily N-acetyltransferase
MATTAPALHEEHVLADGTIVELRHIRPDDAAELRRGFERLSPESRYRRFLTGVPSLSDEAIRYLTCVDGTDHVAIVALTRAPGSAEEIGLAVGRFIRATDDPKVAEAAIAVVDDMQNKGLGHLLALALARAALERGVERFRGEILADNAAVRQLLADAGALVRQLPDGSTVFELDLHAAEGTAASTFERAVRGLLRAAADYLVGAIRQVAAAHD